ncbi:WRKY transcription factor 70 [Actinidia chinensis var. chinensis]|uniref:WRKY transcription factor 70 n=1 Tax=Actinidia chinensis var. chinensis TaxID=1590841 RepID=A0A2R6PLQ3_ACTCC|nr:WRKY transcription factor 70 [Actinidia chinensis var. chinensis]
MGILRPEKLCANRKRLMEELVMGQDKAAQLRNLLEKPTGPGDSGPASAEGLLVKILGSFCTSLSLLKCACDSCELCHIQASFQVGSEDSGENSKQSAAKERRGCYKRRKTLDAWIKILPTMEDGHAWRKYGQKQILNAKFSRCYFRCTHKYDQGCLATKQVQKIQEEPHQMYQTTYFGHHTCTNTLKISQHTLDYDPPQPYLLSFQSNNITSDVQDHHPSCPISVKTECNKEEIECNLSGKLPVAAVAAESNMWADLLTMRSDHEDVISSTTTTISHDLEMDFLIDECVDFQNDFCFGEGE